MWDCVKCGAMAIAGSLGFCPQCFKPKEDDVPKATSGGASNAKAAPGEAGYIAPEPKTAKTTKGEPESDAETAVTPKTAVPAVDLRPPAATGSAPAAASSEPPADTDAPKGA